jgi:Icc-related predicted phosphoesterase
MDDRLVRVAALGDPHVVPGIRGRLASALAALAGDADLLLLAGDLTNAGRPAEIEALCTELADLDRPAVAVLGNHDHDSGEGDRLAAGLRAVGVHVVEAGGVSFDVRGVRVGVAGLKGTGGGFETGVPVPEEVVERSSGVVERTDSVCRLEAALRGLDADVRIALTHYAPAPGTLAGEPPELWAHLGSRLLGAAVDAGGAHLAVHGHAHFGTERGTTPGGCPVRNVAQPVIGRPYAVYTLSAATGALLPVVGEEAGRSEPGSC